MNLKDFIKKILPDDLIKILRKLKVKMGIIHGSKKTKSLLQFDVHITDHCNLNCCSCTHFSPLIENNFMDIDTFERDFERLGKLTGGQVKFIKFTGGEPLLHNKIIDFLNIGRKYFPKGELTIITNGILLPQQGEEFWLNCNKNNINIQISNYPIKINWDKINNLAKQYKVIVNHSGKNEKILWKKMKLDLNGQQNIYENFLLCSQSNECIHLNNGKLYTCPVAAHIKYFNKSFDKDLQITESDYIDIYKANNLTEILDFLSKPIPFCRFCNILGEKKIDWSISERSIQEWT